MSAIRKYLFFLIPFLVFPACPTVCITSFEHQDQLVTARELPLAGDLFNSEGLAPNQELECKYTYYQAGFEAYEELGTEVYDCGPITTDMLGHFSSTIDLPTDGLYHIEFSYPPSEVREIGEGIVVGVLTPLVDSITSRDRTPQFPQLITLLRDLERQPNQYIYLDWASSPGEYWAGQEQIRRFFNETMDGLSGPETMILANLCKAEIEEVLDEFYDGVRVSTTDSPAPNAQTMKMYGCSGWLEWCSTDDAPLGSCGGALDYGNQHGLNWPECGVYLPAIVRYVLDWPREIGFSESSWPSTYLRGRNVTFDDPEERVRDCVYLFGRTAAHEMGHALGLVSPDKMYGSLGSGGPWGSHNPMNTSYPDVVMANRRPFKGIMTVGVDYGGNGGYLYFAHCERYDFPDQEAMRCPFYFNSINWQYLEEIQ